MKAIALAFLACSIVSLCALSVGSGGFGVPEDAWLRAQRGLRTLAALLTGMGLSLGGVWAQALFRNELVEPFLLGLSGGAAAGAVLSLWLFPGSSPAIGAAIGALGAALAVRALAWQSDAALLLTGVAVGAMTGSLAGLVLTLSAQQQLLRPATHWLWGGFADPDPQLMAASGVALALALTATWFGRDHLDRLLLGDDLARSLGTPVGLLRSAGFALISLLTALCVLCGGIVGFIGLLAPHLARRLTSGAHRVMPIVACLLGGCLLVTSDALARSLFSPREVPTGLLTSLCGAPLFLLALRRRHS
ncbi:MAG TPA: iron ABC transporter permease [Polyangiales bacterium]|nr:iron ABC transporter permease [Polyangiales bacterium]